MDYVIYEYYTVLLQSNCRISLLKAYLESYVARNNWFLHHDNAPAHTSLVVRHFLTSKNITVIPHPHYSSDLAPFDFLLFPRMKLRLKGRRFDTTEKIHAETQEVIGTLTFQNFQGCIKSWETRWVHCVHSQGDYLEGDGGH
jgi:transposase